MSRLIGRKKQIEILRDALQSNKPEMVVLIGRRRVGKTFLVRETYRKEIVFELTGLQNGSLADQLQNFAITFARAFPKASLAAAQPTNWLAAFDLLASAIEDSRDIREKPVIFLDELPWLGTRRSGFIQALGYFWNSRASKSQIVVVICGSAASWMINKVVNDKGGLHNRVTRMIFLEPFSLMETELLCRSRNIRLPRYQLLQVYMVMGGIPMYLDQLQPGRSAVENIQAICFARNGYLRKEFDRLFSSLFEHYEKHISIVRALAKKRIGMVRKELVATAKLSDGGGVDRVLNELAESGFITIYGSFKKKRRSKLYRLTDFFSLFYLTYMEKLSDSADVEFTQLNSLPAWRSWSGYAFENICLSHLAQIKRALGISGISTQSSSFYAIAQDDLPGAQIDLLIKRADQTIHLCEAKFTETSLRISKSLKNDLARKQEVFKYHTASQAHLLLTLITTFPPKGGILEADIDRVVTMDELFVE